MAGSDDEVTPAGWYRQPDDPNLLRWWDGDDWTDDTMPVPASAGRRAAAKKAGAVATATREPRRTEPTGPRRTRRDAMAEAEAAARGEAPPVEIELERDPAPDLGEPDPPTGEVDVPAEPTPEREPEPEPPPEEPPTRRRRATAPDGGPGYVRTTPETVRVLADPAVDEWPADGWSGEGDRTSAEDWAASAWSADQPRTPRPPARPRPEATPPARVQGPSAADRSPALRQVQRPTRPQPQERPPTPARKPQAQPQPRPRDEVDHRPSRMASGPSPATAATLLRIIVRAAIIAVLVGVAWFAFTKIRDAQPQDAATLSQDPAAVTVDPDAARLDQIILTLADLPRGWSSQAKNPSNGDLCNGRVPESVIEPTASQSAAFTFSDSGAVIGNTVLEFPNDDTAGAYLDLSARVLDSCREQARDGATTHLVPLDFPSFGDDSFVAELTGEGGSGPVHGAIVYVRHDNRVASIVSITLGQDELDRELVEHLVDLVTRRMGSKPEISNELPGDSGDTGEIPGG